MTTATPTTSHADQTDVSAAQPRPLDEVEHEICSLAGQIAAATARFLTLLADFDERRGWSGDGIRSCAHWLSWRCGLSLVTAREHVRVARRLRELPETSAEFADGRLSYSKVRAIARVATPDTETDLVHAGLHAPAAHVERLVRNLAHVEVADDGSGADYRPPWTRDVDAPVTDPDRLRVNWRWLDNGCLQISGLLSPEDGAALLATAEAGALALHATGDETPDVRTIRSPDSGMFSSSVVGAVCSAAAERFAETEAPRVAHAAEVQVHVDADLLTGLRAEVAREQSGRQDPRPPRAHLDNGPALTLAVIERLACDGGIQLTTHGSDGRTLDLGRRRRHNRAQQKALIARDGGCAVPSCGRTRFLHVHHVVFWSRGGRTTLDNLVLLCGEHHRLVHDDASADQLVIHALGKQAFRFSSRDGREIVRAPRTTGDASELVDDYTHIADDAITAYWLGDSIDHDWFIHAYGTKRGRELARERAARPPARDDSAESPHAA